MPVVTPNIGITASTDILAVDQASVDLVYALKEEDHKDLVERMETRHGASSAHLYERAEDGK